MPNRAHLIPIALLAALALGGCDPESYIVKDELGEAVADGESVREMRGRITLADLRRDGDGGGTLDFLFVYLLGIVDPDGIAAIQWRYTLFHPDRTEIASGEDTMREAAPELSQVLVHSELPGRRRSLIVGPGRLVNGQTYVLRLTLWYREAILFETLVPVEPGVPLVDPIDPEELPELLNGF